MTSVKNTDVLVIDDDTNLARVIFYELKQRGYTIETAHSGKEGLELFQKQDFDVVLTDLRMGELSGMDVLKRIKDVSPEALVIIMTAYGTMDDAMKAVRLGAADYLTKPFATDQLAFVIEKSLRIRDLERSNVNLRQQVLDKSRFENLIGESKQMKQVIHTAEKVAASDAPVLLLGETGTGKEELAKAIHANSVRGSEKFVPVNAGSIPENLMESELFGHEKGAFTGAERRHVGSFEQADGGTIFLDEIAELPLHVQVKLLRVLQEHNIQRVGGESPIELDIRVIAATNQDLDELIQEGLFREDLYYRLNVVSIMLPPLRERNGDIDLLADYFLNEFSSKKKLSDEVYTLLHRHSFPGNVRELRNAMQRAVVMSESDIIEPEDLPPHFKEREEHHGNQQMNFEGMSLEQIEREAIIQALERHDGNQTRAAKALDIPRHVLLYRLKKYAIEA